MKKIPKRKTADRRRDFGINKRDRKACEAQKGGGFRRLYRRQYADQNSRIIQKLSSAVTPLTKLPQSRSRTVIRIGQSLTVARLVRS